MGVLLYSPGVRVHIESKFGIIDVTDDLASGTMTLRENNTSTFQFVINNHRRKYDNVFTPNDRMIVQMKRVGPFFQNFAGYLDQVPYFTVYPRAVQLQATCSLKRVKFRPWDAGSPDAYNLLHVDNQGSAQDVDGGLKKQVMSLLTEVADWPSEQIHIAEIPNDWFLKVEDLRNKVLPRIQVDQATLGSGTTVSGQGASSMGPTSMAPDGPGTGALPATSGKATWFAGPNDPGAWGGFQLTGESGRSPNDPWYCAMRWPYYDPSVTNTAKPAPGMSWDQVHHAMDWWRNRKILVVNPATHKACVCRAADWGPASSTQGVIDLSQHVNEDVLSLSGRGEVNISFADPSWPLGPIDIAATQQQNAQAPPAATTAPPVGAGVNTGGGPTNADFVALALTRKGDRYDMGATPPASDPNASDFDCSSLVQWSLGRLGIHAPRTADEQAHWCQPISLEQAARTPGALVFHLGGGGPHSHVAISLGDGNGTIEAKGHAYGVVTDTIQNRDFTQGGLVPGLPYTGVNTGASTGTFQGGPPNNNLINAFNWVGGPDPTSSILSGPRALLNDDPILTTIAMLMQASMRSFMTAPNGDFIGWFPDYFGIYGTAGKMLIEDIELAGDGFSLVWNDERMITHQFTAGSMTGYSTGPLPGEAIDVLNEYMTEGIASVEFPEILQALLNVDPNDPVGMAFIDANKILQRFGARVNFSEMQYISSHQAEFWYALYLFQQSWANQFSARIDLTWMPEVYPGMLVQLPGYGFQAYVTAVTHSFDFAGGGFNTSANVVAPSAISAGGKKSGLYGLVAGVA